MSLCGAGLFVGSDFFRAKSRDPHVPLAFCKEEASTEIRGQGRQQQSAGSPSDKGQGGLTEQSAMLITSNLAEGVYGIQMGEITYGASKV